MTGKRGGARKGAGRKPGPTGPKGSLTLWLSADVAAFLETFKQERSAMVENMLRKSEAFKTWKHSAGEVIEVCGKRECKVTGKLAQVYRIAGGAR